MKWFLIICLTFSLGMLSVHYRTFPYTLLVQILNYKTPSAEKPYLDNPHYQKQMDFYKIYPQQEKAQVVLLGDSITFNVNWEELLQTLQVVNRGIDGDTTKGFLARLSTIYALNPEYLYIMGGVNDIRKGYPIEEIIQNYTRLLEALKAHEITPVVQSTLYTSNPEHNKKITQLNNYLEDYTRQHGILYLDLNRYLSDAEEIRPEYTTDGLHLRPVAYQIWAEQLKQTFHKLTFLKQSLAQ